MISLPTLIAMFAALHRGAPSCQLRAAPQPPASQTSGQAPKSGFMEVKARGAEPRRQLRWNPKPGSRGTFELRSSRKTTEQLDQDPAEETANWEMTVKLTLECASTDGRTVRVIFEQASEKDTTIQPEAVAFRNGALGKLRGAVGEFAVDPLGHVSGESWKSGVSPDNAKDADQIMTLLIGLVPKLPEDAVGAGAKWDDGKSRDNCLHVDLVSIKNSAVTTNGHFKMDVPQKPPPAQNGIAFQIISSTSSVSRSLECNLEGLPVGIGTMTIDGVTRMKGTSKSNGKSSLAVTTTTVSTSLRRADK